MPNRFQAHYPHPTALLPAGYDKVWSYSFARVLATITAIGYGSTRSTALGVSGRSPQRVRAASQENGRWD